MQIIQTLRRTASAVLGVLISCTMLPVLPQSVSAATTITVGSGGTYRTVTEAVNAAAAMKPSSEADRITIAIAPGTYREQIIINTPYLSFVNSNPSGGEVLLTWYYGIGYQYYSCDNNGYYNAANAAAKSSKGKPARWGTAVRINSGAKYFRAENITFENSFNRYLTNEEIADGVSISGESSITYQRYHGVEVRSKAATERAAACCVEAAYSEFYNCNFYSSQDTLYTSAAAYFKDCKIEGNTDYIFGSGDIVFDECELSFGGYSDKAVGGYITAAREQSLGYLFWNCTVTANPNLIASSGYFGRPWRDTAHVLFYNTKLQYESIITPVGWTSMSGVDPSQATFREFGTTTMNGGGVNTGSRTPGTVLYSCNATRETYLNGWTPYYFNMTTPPVVINGNLLSEVTVNDRANAAKWIMADHLSVGSNAFGDRDFTYISVPEALQGAEFIQTACDSKYYTSDLAEITVKEPIKLYVALDTRLSPVPAWIGERGFTQTDMTLAISNDVSFHVYQKAVQAGETITLGSNTTGVNVVGYTVMAQPVPIVYQGELVQDLNLLDRTNGQNWGIAQNLQVGDAVFGDRDFTFTAISEPLLGSEYIRTGCDSKYSSGNLATFVAAKDLTVSVGVDTRIDAPAWLADWTKTDLSCSTSNDVTLAIYQKNAAAGETIILGENGSSANCVNYIVMAAEQKAPEVIEPLKGDVNCDGRVKIEDVVLLSRYVAEDTSISITAEGVVNAECDGMAGLDAGDTAAILMYLAGLMEHL